MMPFKIYTFCKKHTCTIQTMDYTDIWILTVLVWFRIVFSKRFWKMEQK